MKKNSVLIELTPLLDVILIMLFFILVQSEGRMGDFYEETREALEAEFAIMEADLEAYMAEHIHELETLRGISASYDALRLGLEEDPSIIMVSIINDINDIDTRWILVESGNDSTRIDLCWNAPARDAAALELNTAMAAKIQDMENGIVVVAFRFDSGSIFAADHRMVSGAIHIQRQFNQLIVAELDIRV